MRLVRTLKKSKQRRSSSSMAKAMPSYYYRDPAEAVDRIRAEAAASIKRKAERDANPRPPKMQEDRRMKRK